MYNETIQETRTSRYSKIMYSVLKKPLSFLADYKNPCWFETAQTTVDGVPATSPVQRHRTLRCLPYYMIVGQPKSGTTDLYFTLTLHPDIERCNIKEPHWWTKARFSKSCNGLCVILVFPFFCAVRQAGWLMQLL